jgi:DNA repair protein RadC
MTDVIRDMPRDDRPRERLLMHGPQLLSDSELLAILLGSGLPGRNAIQLARDLLVNGMSDIRRRTPTDLAKLPGMGPAKAARIVASMELSRRFLEGEPDDPPQFEADGYARKLVGTFSHHAQERLSAAFLDSRHRVISDRQIFIGSIGNALVSTRDVIRFAMLDNAAAVALYHNHPSGNPTPSEDDVRFTKKMKESLGLCDLELVDHLIIGSHRYCSLKNGNFF